MPRHTVTRRLALLASLAATLAACGQAPNIRSPRSYSASPAPVVRYPEYNTNSPYGEANATWRPTVANRDGTVVRPFEPSTAAGRPLYEHAPWATGATAGATGGRAGGANIPGTF